MKKLLSILTLACLLVSVFAVTASAASLTGSDMPILITEVAAVANVEKDFGGLVEIYNNNDAAADLYDYEFDFTTSRSADLTTQMGADKLLGGFFVTT